MAGDARAFRVAGRNVRTLEGEELDAADHARATDVMQRFRRVRVLRLEREQAEVAAKLAMYFRARGAA